MRPQESTLLLTQSGGKWGQNPALQQAPDLLPANPVCCLLS
jgi:hypothetical protein